MLLTEYNEAETLAMFKEEGRAEGRAEAEQRMSLLISKLVAAGRTSDIAAVANAARREQLYKEFGMA